MRPFDLELLRAFAVAMESGSLAQAAPKLCRSQSALSEQLRKLEAFTGVTLLERGKKGVRPTPAGERLLVHARDMLALSERALESVRGVTFVGELRLAITDYFLPSSIADLLKKLRVRYPQGRRFPRGAHGLRGLGQSPLRARRGKRADCRAGDGAAGAAGDGGYRRWPSCAPGPVQRAGRTRGQRGHASAVWVHG